MKMSQEAMQQRADLLSTGMQGVQSAAKTHLANVHAVSSQMLQASASAATLRSEMAHKAASTMLAARYQPLIARLGVMQQEVKEAEAKHATDATNPDIAMDLTDVTLG